MSFPLRPSLLLLSAAALLIGLACDDSTAPVDDNSDLVFQAGPPSLPPGARIAVLQGNPAEAAAFTVRLAFPDGYQVPPHFHPTDENITVISGTFLFGMGDVLEPGAARTLRRGEFITAEAGHHHFAMARGTTVVQLHGIGPLATTYVNPADDPRNP